MGVLVLVRHGQASFGAADYDKLSDIGLAQAYATGRVLADRGVVPSRIYAGEMLRQRKTAERARAGGRWDPPIALDARWNEFDHLAVLRTMPPEHLAHERTFQRRFEDALGLWIAGNAGDDAYPEAFDNFCARVEAALLQVTDDLGRGETALVVTSGGVIAWVAARLIGGDTAQWMRLNRVAINCGLTKVLVGGSELSLVSFNEHGHLAADALTYR
jgi:broad specificity phosphatase PhoE